MQAAGVGWLATANKYFAEELLLDVELIAEEEPKAAAVVQIFSPIARAAETATVPVEHRKAAPDWAHHELC